MLLSTIIEYLEGIAPPGLQEDYDNSGLIVSSGDSKISGALICLDSTEQIIREAKDKNCNLVIAHHPIIFRGLKQLVNANYVERTVRLAIEHDIHLYAIHTNLDNVLARGVSGKIADMLGLKETEVLASKTYFQDGEEWKADLTGSGLIGGIGSQSEEEFLSHLKSSMQLKVIRHTPLLGRSISKVAVCGGSGSFLIKRAIEAGADVYVTADVKYHEFFDADSELVIADIGHYESERFTIDLIHDLLREKFPNFAALKADSVTNPLNYYY